MISSVTTAYNVTPIGSNGVIVVIDKTGRFNIVKVFLIHAEVKPNANVLTGPFIVSVVVNELTSIDIPVAAPNNIFVVVIPCGISTQKC